MRPDRDLADDNDEPVGRQMTFLVQRAVSENKVMGVWSQATTSAGPLVSLGPSLARPSGRQ